MPICIKNHRLILGLVFCATLNAASAAEHSSVTIPTVCTVNGGFNINQARDLRELIKQSHALPGQLLAIGENLDRSLGSCGTDLDAAVAAFLAGLYEDMGDNFRSLQKFEHANTSYVSAEELFIRFPHPDVLLLKTLRNHALSELARGDSTQAELFAPKQAALARDWLHQGNFVSQELRVALLFEADLCNKAGNSSCSRDSREEADQL